MSHDNYEMNYTPDFNSQTHYSSTPFYQQQNFSPPQTAEDTPRATSTPTQVAAPKRPDPRSRLNFDENDTWETVESGNGLDLLCQAIDVTEGHLFSGMILREHGRGYLLIPPEGHKDYGEKYYHNSWWMPSQNGWFFKGEHLDYFLDNGALWELQSEMVEEVLADGENGTQGMIFDDMIFEDFDGGFLVQCYDDHMYYQSQNYHGGIWNTQADGWFFPSSQRSFLENNGCEYQDNSDIVFEGMTYTKCRGRGYKLTPTVDSRFYGLQNFLGQGLWRKTYWFFPSRTSFSARTPRTRRRWRGSFLRSSSTRPPPRP